MQEKRLMYTLVSEHVRIRFTGAVHTIEHELTLAAIPMLKSNLSDAWIPIMAFVTISGFIVVNLIIAVICDAVSNLEDDEKAKIHGDYVDDGKLKRLELHDQVDVLEKKVNDLKKLQQQTTHTLQYMLRHIKSSSDLCKSSKKARSRAKSNIQDVTIPE